MLKDLVDEDSDRPLGIIDGAIPNSQYKMLLGRTHADLMNNSELLKRWIELTGYNLDPWTTKKTLISSFPTAIPKRFF